MCCDCTDTEKNLRYLFLIVSGLGSNSILYQETNFSLFIFIESALPFVKMKQTLVQLLNSLKFQRSKLLLLPNLIFNIVCFFLDSWPLCTTDCILHFTMSEKRQEYVLLWTLLKFHLIDATDFNYPGYPSCVFYIHCFFQEFDNKTL